MTGFLGIDHVPFNVRLRDARLRMGWSRRKLASVTGLQPSSVGAYEALRIWPSETSRQRLATALQDDADYLFPPEVGVALRGRSAHITTSILPMEVLTLDAPEVRLLTQPDPFDDVYDRDRHERLYDMLGSLTKREQLVLRKHFGLDGDPVPLHEIAAEFGVSPSRVQQIEKKALRKLRSPFRSRRIAEVPA